MKTLILIISAFTLTSCITPQQSTYTHIPSPTYNYKSQSQPTGYHVSPSGRYEGYQGGYDITPY